MKPKIFGNKLLCTNTCPGHDYIVISWYCGDVTFLKIFLISWFRKLQAHVQKITYLIKVGDCMNSVFLEFSYVFANNIKKAIMLFHLIFFNGYAIFTKNGYSINRFDYKYRSQYHIKIRSIHRPWKMFKRR